MGLAASLYIQLVAHIDIESNRWVTFLTHIQMLVPGWRIAQLHIHTIHRCNAAWQPASIEDGLHGMQLHQGVRWSDPSIIVLLQELVYTSAQTCGGEGNTYVHIIIRLSGKAQSTTKALITRTIDIPHTYTGKSS
jgi:hypothetical protein